MDPGGSLVESANYVVVIKTTPGYHHTIADNATCS